MILEIDNIELYFKSKRILNGIYLKAETGKVTSVLGSNGCGKSCLLQIAFGTLKAKYSLIRIDQKPLLNPLFLSETTAFLPQHHLTPNNMKTISAFKLFKVDWDDFISGFPQFETYKDLKFHRLSGGERRLFEIYLILKKEAKIVMLDEPFNGIELLFVEKIKMLITKEKERKIILLTDHRYSDVIDISDSLYLLKNGCSKLIKNICELEDYKYLNIGSLSKLKRGN